MFDYEWLKNLKVGDKVIISSSYGSEIRTIERFTKTQIVLNGTLTKFRRKTGDQVGGDVWHRSCLRKATTKRIADIEYKHKHLKTYNKVRDFISSTSRNKISLEKLERILDIINEK